MKRAAAHCLAGASCLHSAVTTTAIFVLLLLFSSSAGTSCTSGVLQLDPVPENWDQCVSSFGLPTRNSIKAVCGVAFKVTVAKNIVRMVPLETGTYNYSGPGYEAPGNPPPLNCKDMNASGLFYPGSTTAASVMLYDDYDFGVRLSNLTKTGPSSVSLFAGRFYVWNGPSGTCIYNYTVISGCVLGAKPARATPAPCPPGHISKVGRYGLSFCAACPAGTYSKGGPGANCKPCPLGTAGERRGLAKCMLCDYGPKTGATFCGFCDARHDHMWTDGTTQCKKCPAGSTSLPGKRRQCVKCYAGKKCCTLNWDKSCPKCTSSAKPRSYTSIFALESAFPAPCMATNYSFCIPQIKININGACQISISNLGYSNTSTSGMSCSWGSSSPIQGPVISAVKDLSKILQGHGPSGFSLIGGKVTSAASPYLNISITTAAGAKCTFRYRALTKPAATLLGAAPKPAPSTPCPVGKYRDTTTDTKPGPCLPCHPGTFSTKPGVCTPCDRGTYTNKYSSPRCSKCPLGTVSPKKGAALCSPCSGSRPQYASSDGITCLTCPKNTKARSVFCLGNAWGSNCCAAGACGGQTRCGPELAAAREAVKDPRFLNMAGPVMEQSLFHLKSHSISADSCKNASFLKCMPVGTKVLVQNSAASEWFFVTPITPTMCDTSNLNVGGLVLGTSLGSLSNQEYQVISDSAARTFSAYATKSASTDGSSTVLITECYATFELLDGFFMDLKPPETSTCPTAGKLVAFSGSHTYCQFCGTGNIRNSTGACQPCPKGTYQPLFAGATCKVCPKGSYCSEGSRKPSPCSLGRYNPKSGGVDFSRDCKACPAGTFTGYGPHTACTKCPAGTISSTGSQACGVPFLTRF